MLIWLMVALSGFALTMTASRWAVQHTAMLAYGLSIPPFLLGVLLVALGTDVPEIANSISASAAGHGDLNVGDSVGSVFTQITLILGIIPFAGGKTQIAPNRAGLVPLLTIAALVLGIWLISDGYLSRLDAAVLLFVWVVSAVLLWRHAPPMSESEVTVPTGHKAFHALVILGSLFLVAVGATAAVRAMLELARMAGISEYAISFFGSSVGTSLPELSVAITASRQGQRDIAFGDVFGACLMDSTVSIGAGPLLFPGAVTAAVAMKGSLLAIAAVALAGWMLSRAGHNRITGAALLVMYGIAYWIL
ncbi:MAG: hypothetical protein ABL967_12290 [Bryobacteraceae bacterium]